MRLNGQKRAKRVTAKGGAFVVRPLGGATRQPILGQKAELRSRLLKPVLVFGLLASLALLSIEPHTVAAHDQQKAITQYSYEVWQAEQGLPQNSVQAILQTRDGYLWLGTQEGVARFDGVRFTVFDTRNTPEFKHNNVHSLLEDQAGNLWIGTNGGLLRFSQGRFTAFTSREGLSQDFINCLYEDRAGNLWVGTFGGGLNRFKDGRFTPYTTKSGLADDFVWALQEDYEGNLWIGTNGGLDCFKEGRFTHYTSKDGLPNDIVWVIRASQESGLWVGTNGGLARLQDGKFTTYTKRDGLTHEGITAIFEDDGGNLWLGTNGGGLNRFTKGRFSAFTSQAGLPNDFVYALFEDREGLLWLGLSGGGLVRLHDGKFSNYTTQDALAHNYVRAIYETRDGSVWIGTQGGGVSRLQQGRFTNYTSQDGLGDNVVMTFYEDRAGNLWLGTNRGISRFRNGRFTNYRKSDGLPHEQVRAFYEDQSGGLWVGTRGGGLCYFKDGKFTDLPAPGFSGEVIRTLYEDSARNVWIGHNAGLTRFKDGQFTTYTTKDGLSHNTVYALVEDVDGALWIGTSGGGLNRFQAGRFTRYTTKEGLFDDVVYQVLDDQLGNLWMSCNRGVFRVSQRELNDFADGKLKRITPVVYGGADGMKSSECNGGSQPAGWRTRDGRLWFPTIKGVAVIDPARFKLNELAPPVLIEKVVVDGRAIAQQEEVSLPPGKGQLEFHYTGLSLVAPTKVRFKYKLEGFDQDWIDAETRRGAYYTNLAPGRYRFRVMACNNDGVWNETGASVALHLQPHFYQIYWFYALCALALALGGVGWYRLRSQRVVARESELTGLVNARTQELLQEIGERQWAEEVLRASEDRYRHIFESSPCPMWVYDLETLAFLAVNAAAVEHYGYKPEEFLAMTIKDIRPPEEVPALLETSAKAAAKAAKSERAGVWRHRKKDGTLIDVDISWHELEFGGRRAGCVLANDITKRQRTEEALRQAKSAAEEANRLKSDFLANMSHEIRTPMNGILGMTELALETDLTMEQREYLEMVKASADSLLTIINDVLDFSKIEAGRLALDPVDFKLHAFLTETVKPLALRARQKGLKLTCQVSPTVPDALIGDSGRLRQVLINLIGNAIKFTEEGEITVMVLRVEDETAPNKARATHSETNGAPIEDVRSVLLAPRAAGFAPHSSVRLYFAVSDTGVGIPPEKQRLIFEAFLQADNSTTRKYGGTGLGLTISARLVELMQGQIGVQSVLGTGSTFYFTAQFGCPASLPEAERGVVRTLAPARAPYLLSDAAPALRVLLAEDNLVNQRLIVRLLEKRGHTVALAHNGRETLAALAVERFDLVLLDVQIPELDGFEVTARIRARERASNSYVPIIALTAHALPGDRERCLAAGMDGCLTKPLQAAELFALIEELAQPLAPASAPNYDHALAVR